MKIGFIGLGIMGRPMALNLKAAGHDIIVPERSSLTDEIRAAAEVVADAKTVAAKSEVVIVMVPDTPDVEAVLFGAGGVAEGLNKGSLVIDMSSISPIATKDFARRIAEKGCDYLDAPVSGGEVGAKQATLTIMVGGPDAAFARATPLFEVMGKNITHVGSENGAGQTCKVANQIIVALNIQAVSEALVFAAKAYNAMNLTGGGSIINISSQASMPSGGGGSLAPYGAAKAGLNHMTRSLAVAWGRTVRVNCVSLGWVETEAMADLLLPQNREQWRTTTDRIPVGRMGTPDEIGEICAFLASDAASYLNGTTIWADGGGT